MSQNFFMAYLNVKVFLKDNSTIFNTPIQFLFIFPFFEKQQQSFISVLNRQETNDFGPSFFLEARWSFHSTK